MFESPQEQEERIKRQAKKTILLLGSLLVISLFFLFLSLAWDYLKPNPALSECREKGFEQGYLSSDGNLYCFKECEDRREPRSCAYREMIV
jgi:hypothetical protein